MAQVTEEEESAKLAETSSKEDTEISDDNKQLKSTSPEAHEVMDTLRDLVTRHQSLLIKIVSRGILGIICLLALPYLMLSILALTNIFGMYAVEFPLTVVGIILFAIVRMICSR